MSNIMKCQMSWNVKCHEMSNVMRCLMLWNVKCYEISNDMKCQMSWNVKCHEMSNVMKCQMSLNVKCHEISNFMKCQRSWNVKYRKIWNVSCSGSLQWTPAVSPCSGPQQRPPIIAEKYHSDYQHSVYLIYSNVIHRSFLSSLSIV